MNQEVKCNITCVLQTGKIKSRYKTGNIYIFFLNIISNFSNILYFSCIVNLKPAGTITVRRKLSNIPKTKPIQIENCSVPFPKNLKIRHPLFGVSYEGNIKNVQ